MNSLSHEKKYNEAKLTKIMARIQTIYASTQIFLSNTKVYFSVAFAVAFILSLARAFLPFTSPFDEHTHLSYLQYVFNWQIPAEGYPMNTWAKDAFSCYAHSIYGRLTFIPCGIHADGSEYPTGGTNTSQIWPPLYFIIVALFMRLPMLFGLDPLMSARVITAILWSVGVAWLGLISWQKSKDILLSLGVVALLVALPSFFFYSSFVSPHSLDPLIAASVILISDRFLKKANSSFEQTVNRSASAGFLAAITNKWGFALIGLSIIVAFAVPQALTAIGFAAILILLSLFISSWRKNPSWLFSYAAIVGLFAVASTVVFYAIYKFWQWQKDFRAIPVIAGVDPSKEGVDLPEAVYSSKFEQVTSVWWNFWPKGLIPEAPAGPDGAATIYPWFLLITALSVAAILFWRKRDWLGYAMLAIFITAPIFSVVYDFMFPTGVPIRYGLIFPIVGVLAVANRSISRWPRIVLLVLISVMYLSAFALNYMFVDRTCVLDPVTLLITCSTTKV